MTPMTVVVDTHVHMYPCFDAGALLGHALGNLRRALAGEEGDCAMVLAATPRMDGWGELAAAADRGRGVDGWHIARGGEEGVLWARGEGPDRLLVVSGVQVVSAEGLEVLLLGSIPPSLAGRPLADIARAAAAAGSMAAVPWGFGKWVGRRGRVLEDLVASADRPPMALADSSGRPPGPLPRILRRARAEGLTVLSGSDPLPLPGQESRAGSAGVRLAGRLPEQAPGRGLLAMLREGAVEGTFGSPRPVLRFLGEQIRLRVGGSCEA